MKTFINTIHKDYLDARINYSIVDSKLEYLGDFVFDFTTYDGELSKLLANKMIDVLEVIVNKTTNKYIKDDENYLNYIMMVNMPFLVDKLEWGTSIRTAWIHCRNDYSIGTVKIDKDEMEDFIKDLLKWIKSE